MDKSTFHRIWLGGSLLPQTPGKISGSISSGNETWRSALGYEYTMPKPAGVEELTMEIHITKTQFPYQFTEEEGVDPYWIGGAAAVNFKNWLRDAMNSCEPVELILERDGDGRESEEGDFYVKDFTWEEDAENTSDTIFTVTFTNALPQPLNQTNTSDGENIRNLRKKEKWIRDPEEEERKKRLEGSGKMSGGVW